MSKFFYNRATTRICAKKPFIVLVLVNFQLATVHFIPQVEQILPLSVVNDQLMTFFVASECLLAKICCSWSSDKFAKRVNCEFFSALFLLLGGSGPKRSMPAEKLGNSSLVSSIFRREGKLHCSLTGWKLKNSKMLTYLRTPVRK